MLICFLPAGNTAMTVQKQARRDRKPVKIPTVQGLEGTALFYLGRYAASEASLRHVLLNRLQRAVRALPQFAEDEALNETLRAAIETIIAKHKKSGALNDAAYAEMKTRSLRRAGRSAQAIRMRLVHKGVARDTIAGALADNEDETSEEAEFKAAEGLAKRRRLGPWRQRPAHKNQFRKDLATMARAGFSLDMARKVLQKTRDDEL
jgi:regulatory protein